MSITQEAATSALLALSLTEAMAGNEPARAKAIARSSTDAELASGATSALMVMAGALGSEGMDRLAQGLDGQNAFAVQVARHLHDGNLADARAIALGTSDAQLIPGALMALSAACQVLGQDGVERLRSELEKIEKDR